MQTFFASEKRIAASEAIIHVKNASAEAKEACSARSLKADAAFSAPPSGSGANKKNAALTKTAKPKAGIGVFPKGCAL